MLLAAAPISHNLAECLPVDCLSGAVGDQSRFGACLARVASGSGEAFPPAGKIVASPEVLEVERANVLADPPGVRVLQALSSMYRGVAIPSVAVSASVAGVQPGPAAQPIVSAGRVDERAGVESGGEGFDVMMANLRDVYRDVIQVSLVSKTTSAVSSSLNKLLSAG
ncbi:nodulation protein NolB [Bradyrhizobium sp. ORS 285]|uniref:nodulation protein NolB n=1 Tax=Bradyrhizobium sp. ORS 285 TaxID=115808 RepID=UPI001560F13B|nr:nodulation protein NolB [Bradyrhizobium sp. ORS 285]